LKSLLNYLLVSLTVFVSCDPSAKESNIPKIYNGPLTTLTKSLILYSDSAIVRTRLTAPLQLDFADKNREFPKGIKLEFFNAQGEKTSTLTAAYGSYKGKDDLYMVRGNVFIIDMENQRFYTEELFWNPTTRKITSDKFIKIETPRDTLMGLGFESDESLSRYKILKPSGKFISD